MRKIENIVASDASRLLSQHHKIKKEENKCSESVNNSQNEEHIREKLISVRIQE